MTVAAFNRTTVLQWVPDRPKTRWLWELQGFLLANWRKNRDLASMCAVRPGYASYPLSRT